jgi:Ca-activated chloride channel family protein
MKRFALALSCLLFISAHTYGQDERDEVLRIDTSLVVVPMRVVDRNGRFVPNLRKENFRVFEDSIEQKLAYLDTDNAPFTVALVLDVSDSARFKLKEIQDAAITFVNQLRPDDRAIIFALDANLNKVYDGQKGDLEHLTTSIRSTKTGSGTSLYDAVETIVKRYLNNSSQRKKAIVLFTDGVDTSSRDTNYEKSLRLAQESNALIYSIQYNTVTDDRPKLADSPFGVNVATPSAEPLSVAYARGSVYLKSLTANSGGRFYLADTVDNLSRTFAQIAAELSEQYSLSYYPHNTAPDGKKRQIKIKTDAPGAKVITRKAYILRSANNYRILEAGGEQ